MPPQPFHLAVQVPALSLMPPTPNFPSAAPQHADLAAPVVLHPSRSGGLNDQKAPPELGGPALGYTGSSLQIAHHFQSWRLRNFLGETAAGCWWWLHPHCHIKSCCWPRSQGGPATHPMAPRCLSALHIFTETIKLAILESPPLHMTQHTELQLSCSLARQDTGPGGGTGSLHPLRI